ncbi:MAG TPA: DUF998 domain-containing protein [Candidatus Lokiarchaeia archaeon]
MCIEIFLNKIKSKYFGILGILFCQIAIMIAYLKYITIDPTFSLFTNFGSDLGIGPNGSDIIFRIGMVFTGIIYIPYILTIILFLKKKSKDQKFINLISILLFIQIIGVSISGLFPFDKKQPIVFQIHIISVIMLFGLGAIGHSLIGFKMSKISNIRSLSYVYYVSAIPMGFFTSIFLVETYFFNRYQTITFLSEWISYILIIICILLTSIYFLHIKLDLSKD